MNEAGDLGFVGSIPQIYEQYLVPLIFMPYAMDMAHRVSQLQPRRVLEVAAGTGVLTRQLRQTLPPDTSIIATDLNQPMLDQAMQVGTAARVEWRQADAQKLPFPDASFDIVVCQFGVMFFPDKVAAFHEARRVLAPRGTFLFSVWDRIEVNEFADMVTRTLADLFPADPPRFMARVPHGYHDRDAIERDLALAGFQQMPFVETVAARSRADSAQIPAFAYCQGTPMRGEIESRDASRLSEVTDACGAAIARRFGSGRVDAGIQAHVAAITRRG
jgi:SAM-dependent methyltransferase